MFRTGQTPAAVLAALAALGSLSARATAQPPAMDIYLAPIEAGQPGDPRNITARPGYDNQPSFAPSGAYLLYTAIDGSDSTAQADVFRYDLSTGKTAQITRTPESEFSPTVVPAGGAFSSVRVELDGTQRLWFFDLDGGNPRLAMASVDSVGYHAWFDATTIPEWLDSLDPKRFERALKVLDTVAI